MEMMIDNVEAIEEPQGIANTGSQLLKMKGISSENTQKKWNTARKRLETDLNKEIKELSEAELDLGENKDINKFKELAEIKALRIADKEARLKLFEGESVPAKFVESRALKLLDEMYSVLEPIVHTKTLYSIPEEIREDIFKEDEVKENTAGFPEDITEETFHLQEIPESDDELDLEEKEIPEEAIEEVIPEEVIEEKELPDEEVEESVQEEEEWSTVENVGAALQEYIDELPVEKEIPGVIEEKEDSSPVETVREIEMPEIAPERYEATDYKDYIDLDEEAAKEEPEEEIKEETEEETNYKDYLDLNLDLDEEVREDKYKRELDTDDTYAIRGLKQMQDELRSIQEANQEAAKAADEAEEQRNVVVKRSEEVEGARLESDKILQEQIERAERQLQERIDAEKKNTEYENNRRQSALAEIDEAERSIQEDEAKIKANAETAEEISKVVEFGTVNIGRR